MGQKRTKAEESESEQSQFDLGEIEHASDKRTKLESSEPRTPQPLTCENLALLQGKMPSQQQGNSKPGKSNKSLESASSHTSADAFRVRQCLTLNGLLIDDDKGLQTGIGKEIVGMAKNKVRSARLSPTPEDVLKEFVEQLQEEELSNEDSFLRYMWWIIVRETRTIKLPKAVQDNADEGVLVKAWKKDNLRFRVNQLFTRGYLPKINTEDELALAKFLEKGEGMTTPKPDLAYGLDDRAFNTAQMAVNEMNADLAGLSSNMWHPFFIIEFKGFKGSMADAKNQACRGGAVMLNTMSLLKEKAGILDNGHQYDAGSFAFSLTMTHTNAELYVHWREFRTTAGKTKVIYHMNYLNSYILRDEDSVERLRVAINNVLDWGVGARKTFILDMLNKIEANMAKSVHLGSVHPKAGESSKIGEDKANAPPSSSTLSQDSSHKRRREDSKG